MLEYALMASLIAMVAVTGVGFVGDETSSTFFQANEAIQAAAAHNPGDSASERGANPFD